MIELEPGQAVLVRLGEGASLAARVARARGTSAELALQTLPMHVPASGDAVVLEVTTPQGIVRLDGRVSSHDGRGTVCVERDGTAQRVQRRDFVRVDAVLPVVVRGGGPGGAERPTFSLNVSGGGLLLARLGDLKLGDAAWVAIDLEDGTPPIEALVTVVREDERDARGVQIMSINPRDEQRLVRYAFKREQIGRIARDG